MQQFESYGKRLSRDEMKTVHGGATTGFLWDCEQDGEFTYCTPTDVNPAHRCGYTSCVAAGSCSDPGTGCP